MSVASFISELWSAQTLDSLKKQLVFAGPSVVNHDYEGTISKAGDRVHINTVGRPTVSTYAPNSTSITPERVNTAGQILVVDQMKYFGFYVDDVDARQAVNGGILLSKAAEEASYSMADKVDQYVAGLYTAAQSANQLGTISVTTTTPTDAYDKILVPLKVKLDEANVPSPGRYVVIPPWLHGRLLLDSRFIKVNESGTETGLRNGIVGRTAGFDVLLSNNAPNVTGDDYAVLAGTPSAISYADQIVETEALRSQTAFADWIRGLHVYGAKVTRPDGIATAIASQT